MPEDAAGRKTDDRHGGNGDDAGLPAFLLRRIRLQALFLWIERLLRALAPLLLLAALFVALSWLGFWRLVPPWLHLGILLLLAGFGLYRIWMRRTAFYPVAFSRAIAALEENDPHRPVTSLRDSPAMGGEDAALLWHRHRQAALARSRNLRPRPPAPALWRQDPYTLRMPVLLLLLLGAIAAGDAAWPRLRDGLLPGPFGGGAVPMRVEIWLIPPEYTAVPPQILKVESQAGGGEKPAALTLPEGSMLKVSASGSPRDLDVRYGGRRLKAARNGDGAIILEAELTESGVLSVAAPAMEPLRRQITVLPDNIPEAVLVNRPSVGRRNALRIAYRAADDYRLRSLTVDIRTLDGKAVAETPLPLAEDGARKAEGVYFADYTAHPLAGSKVRLRLLARDDLGQIGESAAFELTLPERRFTHPVARQLVALRRQLAQAPGQTDVVAGALLLIERDPAAYQGRVATHLAIDLARRQLLRRGTAVQDEVMDLLWAAAVDLEDDGTAMAGMRLRQAQQALQEALARNAPAAEIDRLMNDLSRALQDYLAALARAGGEGGDGADAMQGRSLSGRDLQEMLARARDLARTGARAQAQRLLSRLQDILENLRAQPAGDPAQTRAGQGVLRDLGRLMRRQQQLMDRTERARRRGPAGSAGSMQGRRGGVTVRPLLPPGSAVPPPQALPAPEGGSLRPLAGAQEEARRDLGRLLERLAGALGDIPEPFARADEAMRAARQALERGEGGAALDAQRQSLNQLQRAAEAVEAMIGGMAASGGRGTGGPEGGAPGGWGADGQEILPAEMRIRRSHEILRQLQERRADPARPRRELDYIDRLLKLY